MTGVITQSDVMKLLLKDPKMARWRTMEKEIGSCIAQKLSMINEDSRTIDAFLTMHKDNISSMLVVNTADQLVGVLSASDLKALHGDFKYLLDPVKKFVEEAHHKLGKGTNYLVTCEPTCKINEAGSLIMKEGVHRVFLTNQEKKPVGVVSLTDMLVDVI